MDVAVDLGPIHPIKLGAKSREKPEIFPWVAPKAEGDPERPAGGVHGGLHGLRIFAAETKIGSNIVRGSKP
jgi:hypothetical protein